MNLLEATDEELQHGLRFLSQEISWGKSWADHYEQRAETRWMGALVRKANLAHQELFDAHLAELNRRNTTLQVL